MYFVNVRGKLPVGALCCLLTTLVTKEICFLESLFASLVYESLFIRDSSLKWPGCVVQSVGHLTRKSGVLG